MGTDTLQVLRAVAMRHAWWYAGFALCLCIIGWVLAFTLLLAVQAQSERPMLKDAREKWAKLAQQGDASALNNLGVAEYYLGDRRAAIRNLREAAKKGDVEADSNLHALNCEAASFKDVTNLNVRNSQFDCISAETVGSVELDSSQIGDLAISAWKSLSTEAEERRMWETYAVFGFGVIFVSVMLTLAVLIPHPTPSQYTIFRVVLALAVAAAAALLPGALQVEVSDFVKAGGALGVFVVVYFWDPARHVASPNATP